MLPSRLRLPRAGFGVQKSGKRRTSGHFSMTVGSALPKKGGVAFVVSKKVAATAVARHKLKRQALDALRPYATQRLAVIVHARAGAAALSGTVVRAEISALAKECGLK